MDSGADLDMMSTPLGKLPPPAMHSNKESGPVTAPNYDDLRKSISIPRPDERTPPPASAHMQAPMGQGQGQYMSHQSAPHAMPHTPRGPTSGSQYDAHDYYDAPAPPGHVDRYDPTPPPPPHYAHPNTYAAAPVPMPSYAAPPLPSPPSITPSARGHHRRRKKRSVFSWETIKNKKLWFFTVTLFAVVAFGLPKLRAFFPSIIDPATGSTKLPALAGISCIAGLLFTLTSEMV